MSQNKSWSLVLLLPVVPVIALYLLFEKQNYFELHDTTKGLVAMGPIAAYVFMVGIGYRIYFKIADFDPRLDQLCGNWRFVSTSLGSHTRNGTCAITKVRQQLVVNGDFNEGGQIIGTWKGELTGVSNDNFLMVYSLRQPGTEILYGLVTVPLGAATADSMSGIWSVVGKAELEGTIIYTRKAK
jgi:hypothetical protein